MQTPKKEKVISKEQGFLKACSYCAYQERSQKEVREKLYLLGIEREDAEEIISKLITENFINEERFAKAFAGGKFRIKKWGKAKILNALKGKGISAYCIQKGMADIYPYDYLITLTNLLQKRASVEKEKNLYKKKDKLARHVIAKGYEPELVWEIVNKILPG